MGLNMRCCVDKEAAYQFLKGLQHRLNETLSAPKEMRVEIRELVAAAKQDESRKHMRQPEDAFFYGRTFEIIHNYMQSVEGIGNAEATQSLLSEYYRNMSALCKASPARRRRHPFNKVIGTKPSDIMETWQGLRGASRLKQSCPDFAFRSPFPHKVVFEGKYFESGGKTKAESDLVTNIYQAFFYRALPTIAVDDKMKHPAWDYDYSCLFAYDASENGSLLEAWENLDPEVKAGFWDGANLFVMIIRPSKHVGWDANPGIENHTSAWIGIPAYKRSRSFATTTSPSNPASRIDSSNSSSLTSWRTIWCNTNNFGCDCAASAPSSASEVWKSRM